MGRLAVLGECALMPASGPASSDVLTQKEERGNGTSRYDVHILAQWYSSPEGLKRCRVNETRIGIVATSFGFYARLNISSMRGVRLALRRTIISTALAVSRNGRVKKYAPHSIFGRGIAS